MARGGTLNARRGFNRVPLGSLISEQLSISRAFYKSANGAPLSPNKQPLMQTSASVAPLQQLPVLEVPNFRGRRIVLVIRAVKICHRRVDGLIDINSIQAIDANGIKPSAERGILSPREGTDPAVFAKYAMNAVGLVVDQFRFDREKSKRVRRDNGAPQSGHCAHRAIAFESARAQIKLRLEADRSTMAMPRICPLHERTCRSRLGPASRDPVN
jgi:hypothetical protein